MAEIKGFNGLRFTERAGRIDEVCCPPYDIISDEARTEYLAKSPNNIIRLELPVTKSMQQDEGYGAALGYLNRWLDAEILKVDKKTGIYVYEMCFNVNAHKYSVKGFISLVKLEEFSAGVILPHEETLSKAKEDRFKLMCATGCNFSQIYSLYMDEDGSVFKAVDDCSKDNPNASFEDADGVTHKLWCIYEQDVIENICRKMLDKKLYIADGHHRYETALRYKKFVAENKNEPGTSEYVCMMLVNMENDGLVVFPTHRIVRDLENYNYSELISKSREYFDITENLDRKAAQNILSDNYEQNKKAFALYSGENKYTLMVLKNTDYVKELLPNASDALRGLDVSVLHCLLLERIFGIDKENMSNQVNLTYTRDFDEAVAAVDSGEANCAFLLNPTRVSEIRDVALAGEKMPQKSTYFYPKLTTGLVMNKIFGD